ncbi:MAG TPA: minor capsid protein [Gemmatimonadaceae bacterium]|nr:minor capsid protein [Gemmatimonadaceae bacterium]
MLDDLVWLIERAGLGTYGTDLFKGTLATVQIVGAGPFITLIATGGAAPEGTHNMIHLPAYVHPSAQIVVRAELYDVAETRVKALYELLYPIRNQMVNGTWWRSVTYIQSEPLDLGRDDNGRVRLSFNIDVAKRYSPATSGTL